jgi:hypothetical protein
MAMSAADPHLLSLQQPTFASLSSLGANDVYNWLLGWQPDGGDPHVKMTLIRPATQAVSIANPAQTMHSS